MRETREQELLETREWRKEIVSERDQLRDRVERLEEQLACQCPGSEEGSLTDTRGLHAAEELDIPHAPGIGDEAEIHVSGSGEQRQQEMEDPRTQLEGDAHPPSAQPTVVDSYPIRTVHFTQENEGSHNKGLSPSPPGIVGASLSAPLTLPENSTSHSRPVRGTQVTVIPEEHQQSSSTVTDRGTGVRNQLNS